MALGAATPDRARILRKKRGERVEGRYLDEPQWTPAFRCRYRPERESESRDEGRVRRVKPAQLTALARHVDGTPVAIRADDEVEITQRDGTVTRMKVVGAPSPIRKRSSTIGWSARLQRVTA